MALGEQEAKMKYILSTREIKESDLSVERPFMPEEGDYEIYLKALIEDIQNLDIVLNASISHGSITIEIKDEETFQELHANVKNILKGDMFNKLIATNFEAFR